MAIDMSSYVWVRAIGDWSSPDMLLFPGEVYALTREQYTRAADYVVKLTDADKLLIRNLWRRLHDLTGWLDYDPFEALIVPSTRDDFVEAVL